MNENSECDPNMNFVYIVFRVYGHNKNVVYLATCSSEEKAKQYCIDNKLVPEEVDNRNILERNKTEATIFTTRSAALIKNSKSVVIEKIAVI